MPSNRKRIMLADAVCNTERFLGLSIGARALYTHLSFEASNIGEVRRPMAAAVYYGFPEDGASEWIAELQRAGFMLNVGGRWFLADHRINNEPPRGKAMDACAREWEDAPFGLVYEGEAFKSRLAIADSHEVTESSDTSRKVLLEQEQEQERERGTRTRTRTQTWNMERGASAPPASACPECGFGMEPGATVCEHCGSLLPGGTS